MIIQSSERPLPSEAVGLLETAILGVLGAHQQPLTVREIHAALHHRAMAYTTIMTTMARMTETGMVSRVPAAARYAAAYH
jgi:predicted transcriptional regulator